MLIWGSSDMLMFCQIPSPTQITPYLFNERLLKTSLSSDNCGELGLKVPYYSFFMHLIFPPWGPLTLEHFYVAKAGYSFIFPINWFLRHHFPISVVLKFRLLLLCLCNWCMQMIPALIGCCVLCLIQKAVLFDTLRITSVLIGYLNCHKLRRPMFLRYY